MSPRSLTHDDREAAWRLLLGLYQVSGALSDAGYRLCRRRFFDLGDRDPGLITVLGRALVARREYDEPTRDVLEHIALREGEEGRSARRVVVRCDANLAEFRSERLAWYEEALTGGSLTAGFVLARGALTQRLSERPDLALAGVSRCLAEATPRQWEQAALERDEAVAWLADRSLERPADEAAVSAVEAGLELDRHHLPYLRYLVEAYRPSLGARPVERYLMLFRLAPDDAPNTRFLAEAVIDRRLRIEEAVEVLSAHLRLGAADPSAARLARAHEAVRAERDDDEALGWLTEALAAGDGSRDLYGWQAVCEARRGRVDETSIERLRAVALDPDMPRRWRAEVGLMLAGRLHAGGGRDLELYQAVWQAHAADSRPAWLAAALAPLLAEAGRTDADTVPVYRAAYQAEPNDVLARCLARAYLADRETPIREKIEHWRACLARGEADGDVLVALAQALASEGAATEAALGVVDDMPEGQRPRVLEELCRHRFRQGEYASAETIASRLLRLRPDHADAGWWLAVCRVRRALTAGLALHELELGGGEDPRLANLRRLVAAAVGDEPDDTAVAQAIEDSGVHSPALGVAVAALRGHEVRVPPVETGIPRNTWLLATVEQALGQTARARRRLQATEDPDLRLWERYLAARQALAEGRGAAACELLLPVLHRSGPPWDGPRQLLARLAPRYAPPELLSRLAPLLTEPEQRLASLRVLVQRALAGDDEAAAQVQATAAAADEEALRALPLALVAEQAAGDCLVGDWDRFAERLEQLRAAADQPDRLHWYTALLHRARGQVEAAHAAVFELSESARATPAIAAEVASWYLADGSASRAEAALSHALRHHRENLDLLSAVATLNAQLGRTDKFQALLPVILRHLPGDDPRADTLAILREVLGRPLDELDVGALLEPLERLPAGAARFRLAILYVHVAELIRARQSRAAAQLLGSRLPALRERLTAGELAPLLDELHNAWAYACFCADDCAAAGEALATVGDPRGAKQHNLAVVAEAEAERHAAAAPACLARAAAWREEVAEAWAKVPFDDVAPGYRDALCFALHRHIAGLYRRLESWADELRHLEACIAIRPYDVAIQRASLQPLLAMGEGDKALHKSQWLLLEQPDDLEVQLDHATVLASTRGAAEATAWLDAVAARHPDAAETVRQRREELREKLLESAQRRAESGDFVGMFAVARDVEALADNEQQKARALLQQAFALSQMPGEAENPAVLEQALAKCEQVQASAGAGRTRQRAEVLAEGLRQRLGPLWAKQAEELFLHRRKEYFTLSEQVAAPPPDGLATARGLALAFERVAELYQRAGATGDPAFARQLAPRIEEAQRLAADSRRLEATLATGR